MLLYNLTVGGGVAITALFVVSAIILFLVAWKEGRGVVTNAPVTFYRSTGLGAIVAETGRTCVRARDPRPHDFTRQRHVSSNVYFISNQSRPSTPFQRIVSYRIPRSQDLGYHEKFTYLANGRGFGAFDTKVFHPPLGFNI